MIVGSLCNKVAIFVKGASAMMVTGSGEERIFSFINETTSCCTVLRECFGNSNPSRPLYPCAACGDGGYTSGFSAPIHTGIFSL